ncbi:MAG: hypothetical protein RLP44_21390 [Aggregatilineales bacterium]
MIEAGIEVYRSNYCGTCHTLTIANTHGAFGPDHDDLRDSVGRYITLNTYRGTATNPPDYVRESILDPTICSTPGFESRNHRMPAFTHLSESDVDALVFMLLNQHAE